MSRMRTGLLFFGVFVSITKDERVDRLDCLHTAVAANVYGRSD
jgi:hypothetical protein